MYVLVLKSFGSHNVGDIVTDNNKIAELLSKSDLANKILAVASNGAILGVQLPNFFTGFVALGTGSTTFVEMVGSGYARQAVVFGPMVIGQTVNSALPAPFAATGTWPTQTQFGFYDANGKLIFWFNSVKATLTNGQTLAVPQALHALSFPDLVAPPFAASIIFSPGVPFGYMSNGALIYAGVAIQFSGGQLAVM